MDIETKTQDELRAIYHAMKPVEVCLRDIWYGSGSNFVPGRFTVLECDTAIDLLIGAMQIGDFSSSIENVGIVVLRPFYRAVYRSEVCMRQLWDGSGQPTNPGRFAIAEINDILTNLETWLQAVSTAPPVTYTLTFNSDGGSPTPSDIEVAQGQSTTLPAAPTKTDFTFTGWSDGTTTSAAGGTYTPTDNTDFIALWEAVPPPDPEP